jgi:Fe-S cluster assembly protein SufD
MSDLGTRSETEAERAFRHSAAALRAREPEWLQKLRAEAIGKFKALPDRRQEEFHYTDLRARIEGPYHAETSATQVTDPEAIKLAVRLGASLISVVSGDVVVHDNEVAPQIGTLRTLASVLRDEPARARALLEAAMAKGSALSTLSAGLARDGAIIEIAHNSSATILLDHQPSRAERSSAHLLHHIVLGPAARATLIERHAAPTASDALRQITMSVSVGEGARLEHVRLIASPGSTLLGDLNVSLGRGAEYELTVLAAASRLAREQVTVRLEGQGASSRVIGALLVSDENHFDLNARNLHEAPGCRSEMEVRAVAAGRGRAAIQSLIRVAPGAHGSDGCQLIRGLILSPRAEIDAKPELEILNDDVKCNHGTALGDLDGEAIFYLRSRGIPEFEARRLLVEAFLAKLLSRVEHAGAREMLEEATSFWLASTLRAQEGGDG